MHCTQTSFLQEEALGEAAQKCEQPRRWSSAKSPSTGVSPAALLLPALSPGLPLGLPCTNIVVLLKHMVYVAHPHPEWLMPFLFVMLWLQLTPGFNWNQIYISIKLPFKICVTICPISNVINLYLSLTVGQGEWWIIDATTLGPSHTSFWERETTQRGFWNFWNSTYQGILQRYSAFKFAITHILWNRGRERQHTRVVVVVT